MQRALTRQLIGAVIRLVKILPVLYHLGTETPHQQADGPAVLGKIVSGDILEFVGKRDDGTPIIGETKNADRVQAFKTLAAYAEGLPIAPTVDLTPRESAHMTAEQLAEALPRMVGLLPGATLHKVKLLEALQSDYDVVS